MYGPDTRPRWWPATPTQRGIWVLDSDERLKPTYLVPSVLEFIGPVAQDVLVEAVARTLARHPALRSRFRLDPTGRQVQYETDGPPAEVGLVDAVADGWSARELDELVRVLCWTPFDLAADAPARAEVVRVDADITLLVLTAHHIAFDGWSRHLLMAEIGATYRALLAGTEPVSAPAGHPGVALAGIPAPAPDRVAEVVERLRGAPNKVDLPYDRAPDPGNTSVLGTTAAVELDEQLSGKVLSVAAQEGCTPFMVAVALFAATFARRGTQRDFLIAFGWPGREEPATADMVGMFMATLVLRMQLEDDTSWRELLRLARAAATDAFVDSDVPLDAVATALTPGRQAIWPPLTPILVNVDDLPAELELADGVRGRYLPVDPVYTKYDLDLFVRVDQGPAGPRLRLSVDYPPALFDADTVAGLLADLRAAAGDLAHLTEEPCVYPAGG